MQYVYLIKCKTTSAFFNEFYKVGVAADVENRLAQLQTGNPFELTIEDCFAFDNAEIIERAIHQAWKSERVRGEWFTRPNALDDFQSICQMLGGQVFVPESYDTSDIEVEEAEEASEPTGAKYDYAGMFADGWRMETTSSKGKNGIYWAWRKSENGKRPYIYGGLISELPYPMEEMKARYSDFDIMPRLVAEVKK